MLTTASFFVTDKSMTSSDKDFRFMATNDLVTELQKGSIKLDDDSERKVVKMLLKLLEEKNGEIQNLAVKCLGSLVNKVKEYQVETIVDALCGNVVSDKEQLRDISSIGLKTVISELPLASTALAANVCKRITGRLSSAIEKQEDVSVQLEALDILADFSRFGSLLLNFHTTILAALLPQLSSPLQAVRKRTIVALSHLVMSCNNALYIELIDFLLDGLSLNAATSTTRTYIQCIAAICRQAGHRFGEHIERVMPLIVQYSKEEDDELREYCLQAFEAFVHGCPKEITPHIHTIIELCLRYIAYDPNYNYDDEGEDGVVMETEEEGDDDENDEYSDDDDMSWKVRRSAAKCLEAVIATRHELLCEFCKTVSPALIARFKEQEENVKSDIFHAYMALLRQMPSVGISLDPDCMEQEGPVCMLQNQVPAIMKAVHNQMKEKSIKTRQDCFTLLKELVVVLPGALTNHIPALIPGIQYSLGDKNSSSNMKIDTLVFVHCLLTSHSPEVFHNHMSVLVPPVITAVGDSFYKITAEALLVLQQLVKVIRPLDSPSNFDLTPFTSELYQCTLIRLKAADIDQEVKERAISCMGQIICNLGDYLQGELHTCLPIFLDRLRNEITRLTTVKALTKVAGSPLRIDLRPILGQAVPILGSFLRKNQRALKLSTLTLLDTLVRNYSSALNTELLNKVIIELAPLLSEADLHIAQLTLTLLTSIAQLHPAALTRVSDAILPEILTLVKSPLLQGAALNSMLEFFQALVKAGLPGLGHRDLLAMLIAPVSQSVSGSTPPVLHKQAFHSLAKCVAALTVTWPQEALGVVKQFRRDVQNPRSDAQHSFALLVIGEIERHIDASEIQNSHNSSEMDIKEENVLSDDISSEFSRKKRHSNDVAVKTEIKSETAVIKPLLKNIKTEIATSSNNWNIDGKLEDKSESSFTKHLLKNIKTEIATSSNNWNVDGKLEVKSESSFTKHIITNLKTEVASCSNNWNVDGKTESEKQTLVSDLGSQNEGDIVPQNPVMKDKKYNVDHKLSNKIEIKEGPFCEEAETSSVCDDIKDGNVPPIKSSRLCSDTVSVGNSGQLPLSSAEVIRTNKSFSNIRDHLHCESQKGDIREMSTAEEHDLLDQPGKCSDKVELSMRSLTDRSKTPHRCNICGKNFGYLSRLNRHKMIHEDKKPHQCKTCDKSFTQLSNLKAHSFIHDGKKPHQSKTRDKRFGHLSILKKDNLIHKCEKPHQCKYCDKSFTRLSNLKSHNLIHKGEKPYQCKTCDKRFTQLSNLKAHNLIHDGTKPHQCKICDKSFTQLSNLKAHSFIHDGKKPHQCQTCDKSFTRLSNLKTHNLIHKCEKPHQCKSCDKSFTQLSNLKRHNLIHTREKPYICKTCDKSFTQFSNLKAHSFIHGGTKPHQCKTCDKSFTHLSNLKTHNLIHKCEKPHQCKTCDKSFTQLSNLKRHNLIHENKK